MAELKQLKRNLTELNDAHTRTEQRLMQLQKTLTEAEEGKNLQTHIDDNRLI